MLVIYSVKTNKLKFFWPYRCYPYFRRMFKQFITIFFLLAFLVQTFSKMVIVCSFYANQKYIAANLCVNKAKPKSCCAGKCQLNKKLNKDSKDEKQSLERKLNKQSEIVGLGIISLPVPHTEIAPITIHFPKDIQAKPINRPRACFQPPDITHFA